MGLMFEGTEADMRARGFDDLIIGAVDAAAAGLILRGWRRIAS